MRIIDYTPNSTVDGVGVRQVFWTAGCSHHCKGCHNPQTWDFNAGTNWPVAKIVSTAMKSPYNVTFSGGDPMEQWEELTEVCKELKTKGKDIWVYTGYEWEYIRKNPMKKVLFYIDVLVDGRFVEDLKPPKLVFRGSTNQRIIDVKQSLKEGQFILWKPQKLI